VTAAAVSVLVVLAAAVVLGPLGGRLSLAIAGLGGGAAAVLVVGAVAAAGAPDDGARRAARAGGERGTGAASRQRRARPHAIRTEMILTARDARWSPGSRKGHGRLTLDRISPRMLVMAAAPRRELAVLPASLLAVNWKRLFRRHDGATNVVLSVPINGSPRLFAMRVKLVARSKSGDGMALRVLPLKHTAHRALPKGRSPRVWEDATLYIDPTVTDAIKAMWQALLKYFFGETLAVPDDPTTRTGNSVTYGNRGVYAGPESSDVSSSAAWQRVEEQILTAVGADFGDLAGAAPGVDFFTDREVNGAALFNHHFSEISFHPISSDAVQVRNLAIFDSTVDRLAFNRSEVGAANVRALNVTDFHVTNSAFDTVDLTGSSFGTDPTDPTAPRSVVQNAAFVDVETTRKVKDSSGNEDEATRRLETGQSIFFNNTDFVSVTFQNVDFKGAGVFSTTFQGCGLQGVDFTGAPFRGEALQLRGDTFQPTFDNSIMERVSFDGATLANVSFNNVDFSGGGNTFNGAILSNVDFTGATGLQDIDWTKVTVVGNVYGLAQFANKLTLQDPSYLRSMTFEDGRVPEIDPDTGWDIDPGRPPREGDPGRVRSLVEPRSGVRFAPGTDPPRPIDPVTGNPLQDPQTGRELVFDPSSARLVNPDTGRVFRVDYETGRLEDE
jgi:uncharacterized protein YjbI with pentapeptide repeats